MVIYTTLYIICTHTYIFSNHFGCCVLYFWEFILHEFFSRVTNSPVCSKHESSLFSAFPAIWCFLIQFSSLSPPNPLFCQYVCAHRLTYTTVGAGFCKHTICLKHLWPTEVSEQQWENNNKDEHPGDVRSLNPMGHITQFSLSMNYFKLINCVT